MRRAGARDPRERLAGLAARRCGSAVGDEDGVTQPRRSDTVTVTVTSVPGVD